MRAAVPALVLAMAMPGAVLAATPKIGALAPALTVRTLSGDLVDLARPPGKVLAVNVWATWCTPCRAEMPMLNDFYQRHKDEGVLVVGVSADRTRDAGDVRKVMSAFAYPAALLAEAKVDKLDDPRVLPLTYVVDRSGVVRAVYGGAGTPLTAQLLAAAVDEALKAPAN